MEYGNGIVGDMCVHMLDMPRWMSSGGRVARDRAFQAMMTMKKLDIAAMEKAFRGE